MWLLLCIMYLVHMLTGFSQAVLLLLKSPLPWPRGLADGRAPPSECLMQWDWGGIWEFIFLTGSQVMLMLQPGVGTTLWEPLLSVIGRGFLGQGECIFSALQNNAKPFSKVVSVQPCQQGMIILLFCHPPANICHCRASAFAKAVSMEVTSHCGFTFYFLVTVCIQHYFVLVSGVQQSRETFIQVIKRSLQ